MDFHITKVCQLSISDSVSITISNPQNMYGVMRLVLSLQITVKVIAHVQKEVLVLQYLYSITAIVSLVLLLVMIITKFMICMDPLWDGRGFAYLLANDCMLLYWSTMVSTMTSLNLRVELFEARFCCNTMKFGSYNLYRSYISSWLAICLLPI